MKTINNFINEKLRISSKTRYKYFPTTRDELRKLLEERLENDKDADLNDIDVSEITDMGCSNYATSLGLFEKLDPHNIDISEWNVSNVEYMAFMFYRCENLNCDLSGWDVSKVKTMEGMFNECFVFKGKGLENWDVSNVEDMESMFLGCKTFNADLSNWNVSKVESMDSMFYRCINFKGYGLEKWKFSNTQLKNINMDNLFTNTPVDDNPPKWYIKWMHI